MHTTHLTKWLVNFGLLMLGMYFAIKGIGEYMEGKTTFSLEEHPLTGSDQPTITICFATPGTYKESYKYWDEVLIYYVHTKKNPLSLGINDIDDGMNGTILLKQVRTQPYRDICYKITRSSEIDFYRVPRYMVLFAQGVNPPKTAEAYFTSEANSYGIAWRGPDTKGAWFDGKVQQYTLQHGMRHRIHITKVTAYEYLRSKCSEDSFYRWVSTRLAELAATTRTNNQTCKMLSDEPCLPDKVKLPSSVPLVDLPTCNSTAAAHCYWSLFLDIHSNFSSERGAVKTTMTCSIQEYELEERDTYLAYWQNNNSYNFAYSFSRPQSTRGTRTTESVKTVHTELLIHTGFTLVGSVGGWFGLMIGFSFNGLAEDIIGLVHKFVMKLQ